MRAMRVMRIAHRIVRALKRDMCHTRATCVVGLTQGPTQPNDATKMQNWSLKCTLVAMHHQMSALGPSKQQLQPSCHFDLASKGVTVGVQKNR